MFGNLIRVCGVLDSLSETAQKTLSNLITLFLGLTCAFLAYMRNYQYKKKSTAYKILQVILILMAILYIYMGAMGIYTLFR